MYSLIVNKRASLADIVAVGMSNARGRPTHSRGMGLGKKYWAIICVAPDMHDTNKLLVAGYARYSSPVHVGTVLGDHERGLCYNVGYTDGTVIPHCYALVLVDEEEEER